MSARMCTYCFRGIGYKRELIDSSRSLHTIGTGRNNTNGR